jgi:hypothetical protein
VRQGLGIGKIIGLVVVGVIVVGAVGAAGNKEKQRQRQEVAAPSAPPVEAPPVEVSADKLASDYKANEVSADELYRGKVLRVSGVVHSIKKGITDEPYVVLRAAHEFLGVHANFEDASGLRDLAPGKQIVVRCIGNNVIMGSPRLKNCVLE